MMSLGRTLLAFSFVALAACAAPRVQETSSSVVQFLYPNGAPAAVQQGPVSLSLPVSVGIAFVPPAASPNGDISRFQENGLSATEQQELLQKVAEHFRKYKIIGSIRIIPQAYLVPGGGWTNVSAVAKMFGVGIVALVSYDQVQRTSEDALSLTYLTLIGAFVIPAEKNSSSTFVDTAVFDVNSHNLLFRAPGISRLYGRSTAVGRSGAIEHQSQVGFSQAVDKMIVNLDKALDQFKVRVKNNPKAYKVKYSDNYHGGGGASGPATLALFLALLAIGGVLRRRECLSADRHSLCQTVCARMREGVKSQN